MAKDAVDSPEVACTAAPERSAVDDFLVDFAFEAAGLELSSLEPCAKAAEARRHVAIEQTTFDATFDDKKDFTISSPFYKGPPMFRAVMFWLYFYFSAVLVPFDPSRNQYILQLQQALCHFLTSLQQAKTKFQRFNEKSINGKEILRIKGLLSFMKVIED